MFQCLNPPGQSQEGISAGDKEWPKVFDSMMELETVWITNYAKDNGVQCKSYTPTVAFRSIMAMRQSEIEDEPEKTGFIFQVFGYESRLTRDEFIETVATPKCNWVFQGTAIRERIKTFLNPDLQDEVLG